IPLHAVVLEAGSKLGPAELGVAASIGRAELRCARQPRVAVLITGDELTPPGVPLGPGRIYGSAGFALGAQVERAGALLTARATVPDDPDGTRSAIAEALDHADVAVAARGCGGGRRHHA